MERLKTYKQFLKDTVEPIIDSYTVYESFYNLEQTSMPKVKILYHTSNPYYRDIILKDGLKPKVGDSYSLHHNNRNDLMPGIFLSTKHYDSTYDDDIYEIDVTKLNPNKFYKDPDEEIDDSWFLYTEKIPVSAMKLIYRGTGDAK